MNSVLNDFIEDVVQCWGCDVFDNLFSVVSRASAFVYDKMVEICFVLFAVLFTFFVFWAVFKHLNPKKPETSDKFYTKSVVRVVINSLFALALLGAGVAVPRLISRITFEPVADITLVYTQSVLSTTPEFVEEHVQSVEPLPIEESDGIFRPELRDKIILLMKTTVSQFQSYMKLGIAIIDKSFSWHEIPLPSAIFRHVLLFLIGLYIAYGFFKLFIRFCFYFVDVIISMAMFSFLFPIALMMMSFRGGDMPQWMSGLGNGLGTNQIKKLINSIVALGAAVITYLVIIIIVARFFSDSGTSTTELMDAIASGTVFSADLSDDNIATLTLFGAIILLYVVNFIYKKIPDVTKMILDAFSVGQEDTMSKQLAGDAEKLVGLVTDKIKNVSSKIINRGDNKDSTGKDGGQK